MSESSNPFCAANEEPPPTYTRHSSDTEPVPSGREFREDLTIADAASPADGMPSRSELEAMLDKYEAASGDAWRVERLHDLWVQIDAGFGLRRRMIADCLRPEDADFIAAARNLLPRILRALLARPEPANPELHPKCPRCGGEMHKEFRCGERIWKCDIYGCFGVRDT